MVWNGFNELFVMLSDAMLTGDGWSTPTTLRARLTPHSRRDFRARPFVRRPHEVLFANCGKSK